MLTRKDLLEGLNPAQEKAVTHADGPLLIIAGAGTGKTTVIARRIACLVMSKQAKPGEVLALTFTDKAAAEMEGRVDLMVPYGYIDISLSTFHAFGDRILRDHALDLGLRPDYRVLSLSEQIIFFREHLFDFPLHYYKALGDPTRHIEALITAISRAKDEDVSPEEYLKWAKRVAKGAKGKSKEEKEEIKKQIEVAQIYQQYQALKLKKGVIDFGDQVGLALKLFREAPAVLKKFRERYKFILVDEFQDTNYAQFELLKLLAGKNGNLTVVGDDDQAIYRFRGAAISNILGFEKVYPKCKKIVLNENYRSTQTILDAAYRLIKHNNPERLEIKIGIDKRLASSLWPAKILHKVEHHHFDRVTSEADWVAQSIKGKKEAGEYKYSDFAILTRANADAEPFRQSLNLLGIPHQSSGGGGLYSFPEVKIAVSFLRALGDPSDSGALYVLSLSGFYRLNPLALQKISTFADRRHYTLHYVFSHLEEAILPESEFSVLADIDEASRAVVRKIMEDISFYLEIAKEKTTGEVLYAFLKKTGYLSGLAKEDDPLNEKRLKNMAEFFVKVREFKDIAEVDRVSEFVKHLNLLREAGDDPESAQPDFDAEAVNILTIHKAKGLEFPVVFMVSLVADKFPVRIRKHPIELPEALIKEKLPAGDFHLMEERRLFYVGMTRAQKELYFTSAVDYGGKRDRKVSPFVLEALDLPKADISVLKSHPLNQLELFSAPPPIIPQERKKGPDEVISLSHYQIEDYLNCPLKYKYVHILRVPLLPNHQIIYGSALHKAAQAYFTARKNQQKFTLKGLLGTFKHNWSSEGFISRQHEEQRFAAGNAALQKFFKEEKKRKRIPRFVEEEFMIVEDSVKVRGRWDLVEEKDDKIYVVDFKSSDVRTQEKAEEKVKESRQLAIYALAWLKMFGTLPDFLELYFIETGLVGSIEGKKINLVKTWEAIKKVADGIREADYHAAPGPHICGYCPYNEICPSAV